MPDPEVRLSDYLKAAFNFRPFGMYVAPNWVAIGIAALLGFVNPGFWLLGLAGEGLYLLALVQNGRFRALVDGYHAARVTDRLDAKAIASENERLAALSPGDRRRYEHLRTLAEAIVAEPHADEPIEARTDRERLLRRMLGVFLDLLHARYVLARALAGADDTVHERLRAARIRLAETPPGELFDSLTDQAAVLARRVEAARAAEARAAWIDAELDRIAEHVGLLRDQALLPGDAAPLGAEVDRLTERLAAADRWLSEQQALDGALPDAPTEAPRLRPPERVVR